MSHLCSELGLTAKEELVVKRSNLENIRRKSLLQIAALKGNLKVAKVLVERCQANINKNKMLSLFRAVARCPEACNNQLDVVKYLASKCAHLKTTTAANVKLHIAAGRGHLEILKYLVEECGADIQQQGIWKDGPYPPGIPTSHTAVGSNIQKQS